MHLVKTGFEFMDTHPAFKTDSKFVLKCGYILSVFRKWSVKDNVIWFNFKGVNR